MRSRRIRTTVWGFAAALLTGAAVLTAAPAHAAFAGPCAPAIGNHNATTVLTDRLDSGGGGNWAVDGDQAASPAYKLNRTLSVTLVSHVGGTWSWTARVCDGGAFTTIPGAPAPNQGPGHAGQLIGAQSTGQVTQGLVTYAFTTDQPLSTGPNLGVPASEDGTPAPGTPQSTSLWFEQAFPPGTVFGGGLVTFRYVYQDGLQQWTDASGTDGQGPADGQIT